MAIGSVVLALLGLYLLPVFLTGARIPFGSDTTYYVWMTRLAAHVGLADAGFRAGSHGLLQGMSSVSGLGLLRSIGPLDVALEVALGLAAGALVSVTLGFSRARFVVVSIVTSAYAARMATGYLANLLFLTLFLAALAVLFTDRRRASGLLAGVLFLAAGLSHGAFYGFAFAMLAAAAALRLVWRTSGDVGRRERLLDVRRVVVMAGGSAAVLAALVVAHRLSVGGSSVLHSGDSILRTLGDQRLLKAEYAQRLPGAVNAAGLFATVPLAIWGVWFVARKGFRPSRLVVALTAAGAIATLAGIGAGLVTGLFPAGRVLGVSVWLPVLASVGLLGIAASLSGRPGWARAALTTILTLVLLAAPFRSLLGSNVAASAPELAAVGAAGHFAETLPPHTPLVYVADVGGASPAFQASRYENLARMGLPPERMGDVRLFIGTPQGLASRRPALTGETVHDELARLYLQRLRPLLSGPHVVFYLRPFNHVMWRLTAPGRAIANGVHVLVSPRRHGASTGGVDLAGMDPATRLVFAVLFLLALSLAGYGWVRALLPGAGGVVRVALAPTVGAGALVLASVAADAVGLRLERWAVFVLPVAGVSGYLVARYSGRTIFSGRTASAYSDSLK